MEEQTGGDVYSVHACPACVRVCVAIGRLAPLSLARPHRESNPGRASAGDQQVRAVSSTVAAFPIDRATDGVSTAASGLSLPRCDVGGAKVRPRASARLSTTIGYRLRQSQ